MTEHTHDPRPLIRLSHDEDTLDKLRARVVSEVLPALTRAMEPIAQDVAAEHGLTAEDTGIVMARLVAECTDLHRWVMAGQLRAAGAPIRSVVSGLGYASNTSVQRQIGTAEQPGLIRRAETASRLSVTTGTQQEVVDDSGSWSFSVAAPHRASLG
ncbi:hypothetical protein [Leucobacter sp. cx-169]|uniref:hypothetical protein n=1 Tax=Leucobacter sp. cx-169 TaxID=2770549 RepID=UPI00165E0BD3|nr:hypothetical protein [Leucobacter sp. cx-169]MBC9927178.1 hypothetical protein [Leucobacter sp. cx-169]